MKKLTILSRHEKFLLDLIKNTIALNSPKLALETQAVLKIFSQLKKCRDRVLWAELSPEQQDKFKELIKLSETTRD